MTTKGQSSLLRSASLACFVVCLFLGFFGFVAAGTASAAALDCGQPISVGASPTATDALKTLNRAVGVAVKLACSTCEPVSLCDGLLSIDASGETFDRIEIGNVAEGNDALWAILTPTVGDEGVAAVLFNADGDEELMVPLYPDGGSGGGTVEVSITNGVEVCPIGSLNILPLPAAPADTGANVLASFLALNDAIAADFGLTGADLATTPLDELPTAPPLFPEWSDPQQYATNLGIEVRRATLDLSNLYFSATACSSTCSSSSSPSPWGRRSCEFERPTRSVAHRSAKKWISKSYETESRSKFR